MTPAVASARRTAQVSAPLRAALGVLTDALPATGDASARNVWLVVGAMAWLAVGLLADAAHRRLRGIRRPN